MRIELARPLALPSLMVLAAARHAFSEHTSTDALSANSSSTPVGTTARGRTVGSELISDARLS